MLTMNGVKKKFKKEYPGVSVDWDKLYENYKAVYNDQINFDNPDRVGFNKDCVIWAYRPIEREMKLSLQDFDKAEKALIAANVPMTHAIISKDAYNSLASKPTEPVDYKFLMKPLPYVKEEGINPMNYTTTNAYAPTASATIVNPQTETDKQREYLLQRLKDIYYSGLIRHDLRAMFHIDVNNSPKNFKELIEKIEKKQYKIDKHAAERIEDEDFEHDFWGPFDGIIWDGPKADYDAYAKADREREDAYNAAKDQIWINTPQDALKAIEDFKNWKPSNAPKN